MKEKAKKTVDRRSRRRASALVLSTPRQTATLPTTLHHRVQWYKSKEDSFRRPRLESENASDAHEHSGGELSHLDQSHAVCTLS